MEIEKIYFDMDDTIADFGRGLQEICDIAPIPQDIASDEWADNMWEAVKTAGDFYYRLKECVPGMELFFKLREIYKDKVEILSAIPKPRRGITSSESDKRRWVEEHIGKNIVVNITYSAEEKRNYAKNAGCFLIDDLRSNIEDWRDAGGTGILFFKDNVELTSREILNSGIL